MGNDDLDKKLQAASEMAKNVNASNNSVNVNNPEIHLHNPNIKIPSSLGTGIGLGGTISAGIYALSKSKAVVSMPFGTRAAMIGAGGLIGGGTFVTANYINTIAQKNANNSSNSSCNDSYPAKSIIGEGDSVDNIMYYLNINIIICMVIILLLLLLIYLYVYQRNNVRRIYIL
jgi:hypothetical protein